MSQYEVVVAEMLLEIDINISQRKFLSILFDKVPPVVTLESWMFKRFSKPVKISYTYWNWKKIKVGKRSQSLFSLGGKIQMSHSRWATRSHHFFATTTAAARQQLGRRMAGPKSSTRHRCREMSYHLGMINDGNFSNSQKRNCHYTPSTHNR